MILLKGLKKERQFNPHINKIILKEEFVMKGLLTLRNLSTERIIDIINYALELKQGFRVFYEGKKFVSLFLKIQHVHTTHLTLR